MATAIAPQLIVAQSANSTSSNAANIAKADSADNGSPAFATVLQQKSSAAATQQPAKQADNGQKADAKSTDATATDTNTVTTTASQQPADLRQILPWLNTAQSDTSANTQDSPAGTDTSAVSTTTADASAQALALLQGQQQVAAAVAGQNQQKTTTETSTDSDRKDQKPELPAFGQSGNKQPMTFAATTETTANVAVSEDANNAVDVKQTVQTSVENFEAALNNARAGIAAQTETSKTQQANQSPDTTTLRTESAVGSKTWNNEVGEHIRWMATSNESKAELVLNPPQLGRVEVSLSIKGDQAEASFISANPQVREALEGAMNRLREVLADSGISLGQTHVGAESRFAQQQQSPNTPSTSSSRQTDSGEIVSIAQNNGVSRPSLMQQGLGMVDTFA